MPHHLRRHLSPRVSYLTLFGLLALSIAVLLFTGTMINFREQAVAQIQTVSDPADEPPPDTGEPAVDMNPETGHGGSGVTVTDTHIITAHDKVPRLCNPPTVTTVKSGSWDDPAVWSTNQIPVNDDRVQIRDGHAVSYAVQNTARIYCIEIHGSLSFATDRNTKLQVGTMTIMPSGAIIIGTGQNPIRSDVTAEIVITDTPLETGTVENPGRDPSQFGTGIIGFGTIRMHGSIKTPFIRLAKEAKKGDAAITLEQSPTSWKAGDRLILPDTRQLPLVNKISSIGFDLSPQREELIIARVAGAEIALASPLNFNHWGARDLNGRLEFLPHVANLDRNILIRSENPSGTRGHTWFTHRAVVNINGVQFKDLGRTTAETLDNTTFDSAGKVTHIGTNHIARYAVHTHHLNGRENPANTGYQFQLTGNVVDGFGKWAYTIHASHFGLIRANIAYNGRGGGFVTENGSETENVIEGNFATAIDGRGSITTTHGGASASPGMIAFEGSAFWFRGPHNIVRNNAAADVRHAGYNYNFYYHGGEVRTPLARGVDPADPAKTKLWIASGSFAKKQTEAITFLESAGNEAYGATTCLWSTWPRGTGTVAAYLTPALFENYRCWNIHRWGFYGYHHANIILDGFVVRGDPKITALNEGGPHRTLVGLRLQASNYQQGGITVRNADVQGMNVGVALAANSAAPPLPNGKHPPTVVENSFLRNYVNIQEFSNQFGKLKEAFLRNVRLAEMPLPKTPEGLPSRPTAILMGDPGSGGTNNQNPTRTFVIDYNGIVGDNFELFFENQRPDYVLNSCPEPNLTNAQCFAKYGIAVAGAVAPCIERDQDPTCAQAKARAADRNIIGLLFAFTGAEPPPPPLVPIRTEPLPISSPSPAPAPTPAPLPGAQEMRPQVAFTNLDIRDGTVTVRYLGDDLSPARAVLLQFDTALPVTTRGIKGTHTFRDIAPGAHRLTGQLVDGAGIQLANVDPAIVNFTVTAGQPQTIGLFALRTYNLARRGGSFSQASADWSGLTYNPRTRTLFGIDNRTKIIGETDLNGNLLRLIKTSGLQDPEGITFVRSLDAATDLFATVDETKYLMHFLEIGPTTTTVKPRQTFVVDTITSGVGDGLEGISYDPTSDTFYFVEEGGTKRILTVKVAPDDSVTRKVLFQATNLPTKGLGDIFVNGDLSPNIFVMGKRPSSNKPSVIFEVTHRGDVVSSLSLLTQWQLAAIPEGLTFFGAARLCGDGEPKSDGNFFCLWPFTGTSPPFVTPPAPIFVPTPVSPTTPIATPTPTPAPAPLCLNIQSSVRQYQGKPHNFSSVKVEIKKGDGTVLVNKSSYVSDSSGNIRLPVADTASLAFATPYTYSIKIKSHLPITLPNTATFASGACLAIGTAIAGDFDDDNKLTLKDLLDFIANFRTHNNPAINSLFPQPTLGNLVRLIVDYTKQNER